MISTPLLHRPQHLSPCVSQSPFIPSLLTHFFKALFILPTEVLFSSLSLGIYINTNNRDPDSILIQRWFSNLETLGWVLPCSHHPVGLAYSSLTLCSVPPLTRSGCTSRQVAGWLQQMWLSHPCMTISLATHRSTFLELSQEYNFNQQRLERNMSHQCILSFPCS